MATFDLGRVTPIYKGDYSASAPYELNDVVLYNGNLYWNVQSTPTVGILPTDTTVWKLAFTDDGVRAEIRGYAESANTSAQAASVARTAAEAAAISAQAEAEDAEAAKTAAQTAESNAQGFAQTASEKASQASESAAQAQESVTDAQAEVTRARAEADRAKTYADRATEVELEIPTKVSELENDAGYLTEHQSLADYVRKDVLYNMLPVDTASGSIASFPDGADDIPLKSLVVDINPVQSGSGDPSPDNVRPISGWTGMTVNANGTEIPISWESEAGTVYGGKLDVTNGVLTVDKVIADMGTLNWTYASAKQRIVAQVNRAKPYGANLGFDGACSVYKVVTDVGYQQAPDKSIIIGNNFISNAYAAMVVFDSAYTDAETFKTAVSGQTLVFPVKNPIVYQLTPTEVKSILGQNNIWNDTGDTTAEYRADTSAYIAKKIAEAISALS